MVPCAFLDPFRALAVRTRIPMPGGDLLPLLCPPSTALAGLGRPDYAHTHVPGDSVRLDTVAGRHLIQNPQPGQPVETVLRPGASFKLGEI